MKMVTLMPPRVRPTPIMIRAVRPSAWVRGCLSRKRRLAMAVDLMLLFCIGFRALGNWPYHSFMESKLFRTSLVCNARVLI